MAFDIIANTLHISNKRTGSEVRHWTIRKVGQISNRHLKRKNDRAEEGLYDLWFAVATAKSVTRSSRCYQTTVLGFNLLIFGNWGLFLESSETFWAHFRRHNSVCICTTKASRGTKLCSCFHFYSLYNKWKEQLYRITGSEFYEWLFGPEKISGLSRNRPLQRVGSICSNLHYMHKWSDLSFPYLTAPTCGYPWLWSFEILSQ